MQGLIPAMLLSHGLQPLTVVWELPKSSSPKAPVSILTPVWSLGRTRQQELISAL